MEPTPSELLYLQEHIDETRVPDIIISSIVCGVITTACVCLRFFSRFLKRAGVGKDDYCLIIGLVLYLAYIIFLCIETEYGVGRHVLVVDNARMLTILILCDENIYVVGILFIKYSILLLYHRVFPSKTFRNYLIATAALVMAWALAAFFSDTFTCFPIESQWDSSINGTCIDYGAVTLGIGIVNVVIDFILLGLPLPILWNLQMSTRRKIMLAFTLGAGSSACVASIVRLTYAKDTLSTFDKTWDSVTVAILSGVEMCTAIVACCVATYRPLVERFFYGKLFSSNGARRDQSDASGSNGWGKISVRREVDIEMEPSKAQAAFSALDVESAPLKSPPHIGGPATSEERSVSPSDQWDGPSPHHWQTNVSTHAS